MKILRWARLCGESNPFGELLRVFVRNGRRVEHCDTAAACLVVLELLVSFRTPVVIPEVEHHYVRGAPLLRTILDGVNLKGNCCAKRQETGSHSQRAGWEDLRGEAAASIESTALAPVSNALAVASWLGLASDPKVHNQSILLREE